MNGNTITMARRLYAIRDDKQQEFNPPVVIPNDAVASRTFGDYVNKDKSSMLYVHAGDFSFWYLGSYDAETGLFITDEAAHIICRASDFVSTEE